MAILGNRTLKAAKFFLLPQVFPRFAELVFSGFGYLAYFIAQVYRGVRLLPEGHPYLNPSQIGHFSVVNVIAAAGKQLRYRKENIDQIIIFYTILLGMVLVGLQIVYLFIGIFAPQAMALSLTAYFGNNHADFGVDPYQDLAFIMLDRVFGVPGIFESCVSDTTVPCYMAAPNDTWDTAQTVYRPGTFPWPFHDALHAMFSFYSTGLLVIAVMILLYMVVVVIAETAQTGVPFGKRFNKVWAPIRLVVAFGLLIPVTYGLNSAQYIVLYAAKLGSNFATNGWVKFSQSIDASNQRLISEQMVAYPGTPEVGGLLQFMMLAHTCKAIQEGVLSQADRPDGWKVKGGTDCPTAGANGIDGGNQRNDAVVNAYLVKYSGDASNDAVPLEKTSYADARAFFGNGDMTISFGDRGCENEHKKSMGHTIPLCGQLALPIPIQESDTSAGAYVIQEGYYDLVKYMWGEYIDSAADEVRIWDKWGFCNKSVGGGYVQKYKTFTYDEIMGATVKGDMALRSVALSAIQDQCPAEVKPDTSLNVGISQSWIQGTHENYMYGNNDVEAPNLVTASAVYSPGSATASAVVTNIIRKGVKAEQDLVTGGKYKMPRDMMDRGWAGAGLWYNNIARANGAITGSALNVPKIVHLPEMMEVVARAKMKNNQKVNPENLFTPVKGEESDMQLRRAGEAQAVVALQSIYSAWKDVGNEYKPTTGNAIYDFINWLFGTQGLSGLRDPANSGVHPLALMTAMGKSLVEASIRNIGIAAAGSVGGAIAGNLEALGPLAGVASSMLFTIVSMTLGAGIILYYVLPFMPFVYFFFAVGSWIKEVFEAMVGVPLWALAHIRIDGDGLPGEAARSGYFMIFEIFLRPIMIVFGLLASIATFASMATVLNSIFTLAVTNAGGTTGSDAGIVSAAEFMRGPIDQLFYTVLYAVIMYIIAMSSFKMIDLIPNQIMRWLGVSINAFAGQTGDSAQNLMSNVQQQGLGKVSQAVGGLRQGADGVAKAAKVAAEG